jgi:hypothetical protein
MPDFATDVSAACNAAGRRANEVFRAIAFDLVARVQELTPVKTGFLRSNWTAILPHEAEPVAGRASPASAAIQRATVGQVITILNPTVYARRIEYGFVGEDKLGRYYNQPGRHMVGQTMAEAETISANALRRITGIAA